jgi:hypothetical protein
MAEQTVIVTINDMNSKGVALLKSTQPKKAIDAFRAALKTLQRGLHDDEAWNNEHHTGMHCMECAVRCVDIEESYCSDNLVSSPHNKLAVFDRCFILQEDCSNEVLSSILIYNMGLAFHHFALRIGKSKLFEESLRLYNMSYQLIQHQICSVQLGGYSNVLVMAITNNMAHINEHFCRYDQVVALINNLEVRLSMTQSNSALLPRDSNFYAFFYVICSCRCIHCSAAAA